MGKVKGTLFGATVEGVRGYHELGVERTPAPLRRYLDSRILSASWYDEEDYLALLNVYAGLLLHPATPEERRPPAGMDVFEYIGKLGAQRFFDSVPFKPDSTSSNQGLYKALVCKNDPAGSLRNYDTFWEMRHDTGQVRVTLEGPGTAQVEIHDYALVSAKYCRTIQGSLAGFLIYSGARDVQLSKSLCRVLGNDRCQWQLTWKDPVSASRRGRSVQVPSFRQVASRSTKRFPS